MEDFDDLIRKPEDGTLDLSHRAFKQLDDEIWTWGDVLQELNVSFNRISEVAPGIAELKFLVTCDFSSNQVTALPAGIGECDRLKVLKLNGNRLETLPSEIGDCKLLEEVYLSENKLVEVPPTFGKLKALKVLKLQNNKMTRLEPEIGSCLVMQDIDVSNNELTNVPEEIRMNTPLIMWSLRYEQTYIEKLGELEEANEALEGHAKNSDQARLQGLKLREELKKMTSERDKLWKERPHRYLAVTNTVSKACTIQ